MCMKTFTGKDIFPQDPESIELSIVDIAHALSFLCRYAGHTQEFYSVAQHCVHMSYLVPEEYAYEALLHDASEAYLADLPHDVKAILPDYQRLEARLERHIARHFFLPHPMSLVVKRMDQRICATEMAFLMNFYDHPLAMEAPVFLIHGWHPEMACEKFIERYVELRSWKNA